MIYKDVSHYYDMKILNLSYRIIMIKLKSEFLYIERFLIKIDENMLFLYFHLFDLLNEYHPSVVMILLNSF